MTFAAEVSTTIPLFGKRGTMGPSSLTRGQSFGCSLNSSKGIATPFTIMSR